MKRVLLIIIILISIFLIYTITKDRKIYYLSLGDELTLQKDNYTEYITEYLVSKNKLEKIVNCYNKHNIRTIDLIDIINHNEPININNKKITIQNALIKADVVTISIGNNDFSSKFILKNLYSEQEIYDYIDEYINDLDNLLKLVRKYCKEKIIIIGYYNLFNDESLENYYRYLITSVKKLTRKYNIYYLDIYDKLADLNYRSDTIYPNKNGYTYIGQEIVKIIKE